MSSTHPLDASEFSEILVRDHAVDLIKGWACLWMVVAHVPFPQAGWLSWTTMGSVLFFSSTGMNLWGLLARRRGDEARIAANGLFLIFAGFANNYVQGTLWQADVFQSAGMAMLAMLALSWLLPRWWTWLFPLPFAIHFLNQHVFYWKIADGGLSSFFLTPGLFPLLPWLSFYMLGAHLKRYPAARMRWGVGACALAGAGGLIWRNGFVLNKFWMSPEYWLLGLAYSALLLDFLRTWLRPGETAWRRHEQSRRPLPTSEARPQPDQREGVQQKAAVPLRRPPLAELRRWGANSLVFYILHSLVIRVLQIWWPSGLGLLLGAIIGTAILLRAGLWLQDWARRQPPWRVLAACAALSGGVLALEASLLSGYYARSFSSFALTIAFLAAYPAFKRLSERLPRRRLAPLGTPAAIAMP